MGRYGYLAKNIGLLTLSSFAAKLLSFLLVPLYTNILTTAEYGSYDILYTSCVILVQVLTFCIADSVFRFSMEPGVDHRGVVTVSAKLLAAGCCVVAAALLANSLLNVSALLQNYSGCFFLLFFSYGLVGMVTAYARGCSRIYDLSVSSVIGTVVMIGSNVLLLLVFPLGLTGYFLANILGPLAQSLYLCQRLKIWKQIQLPRDFQKQKQEMLAYSRPLIGNAISWWVNSASDRYVILWICGIAENGIYSVASKIPAILNILQSIFSQAWSQSAVKDYDPEDSNGFFRNVYSAYNCVLVLGCSGIILLNKPLARLLYAKDFYEAWRYTPFLTIAIIFGSLVGYLAGFFTAVKDSRIVSRSTALGAGTNLLLNLLLTPVMGPLGAAFATVVCYIVMWANRLYHARRYIRLRIRLGRDLVSYGILIFQGIAQLLIPGEGIFLYGLESALLLGQLALYAPELTLALKKGRSLLILISN